MRSETSPPAPPTPPHPPIAPQPPPFRTPAPYPPGPPPRFGRRARWLAGGAVTAVIWLAAVGLMVTGFALFAGGMLPNLGIGTIAITAILASKLPAERREPAL